MRRWMVWGAYRWLRYPWRVCIWEYTQKRAMEIARVVLLFFLLHVCIFTRSRIALATGLDDFAMACFFVLLGKGVFGSSMAEMIPTFLFLLISRSHTETQQQPNHSRPRFRGGGG